MAVNRDQVLKAALAVLVENYDSFPVDDEGRGTLDKSHGFYVLHSINGWSYSLGRISDASLQEPDILAQAMLHPAHLLSVVGSERPHALDPRRLKRNQR